MRIIFKTSTILWKNWEKIIFRHTWSILIISSVMSARKNLITLLRIHDNSPKYAKRGNFNWNPPKFFLFHSWSTLLKTSTILQFCHSRNQTGFTHYALYSIILVVFPSFSRNVIVYKINNCAISSVSSKYLVLQIKTLNPARSIRAWAVSLCRPTMRKIRKKVKFWKARTHTH